MTLEHRAAFRSRNGFYYADDVVIVGDVEVGAGSSLWYGSVLRGDDAAIRIGERVNIQDLTMVHPDPGKPLVVEDDVTVGHRAIIHCVRVGRGSLIGMGSILMEDVEVGAESLVAAGSVVIPGTVIPPRSLVRGVPAKVARETSPEERARMLWAAEKYAGNAVDFHARYGVAE